MQKFIFHCSICGKEIIREADYAIPGVEGFITDNDGNMTMLIDPTLDYLCHDCAIVVNRELSTR